MTTEPMRCRVDSALPHNDFSQSALYPASGAARAFPFLRQDHTTRPWDQTSRLLIGIGLLLYEQPKTAGAHIFRLGEAEDDIGYDLFGLTTGYSIAAQGVSGPGSLSHPLLTGQLLARRKQDGLTGDRVIQLAGFNQHWLGARMSFKEGLIERQPVYARNGTEQSTSQAHSVSNTERLRWYQTEVGVDESEGSDARNLNPEVLRALHGVQIGS